MTQERFQYPEGLFSLAEPMALCGNRRSVRIDHNAQMLRFLHELCPALKRDICIYLYSDMLRAVPMFGGCDEDDDAGGSATDVEDVAPVGGRLVVFDSRAILHEVLPATRVRLAMTAWLLNEEAVLGERTAASLITD